MTQIIPFGRNLLIRPSEKKQILVSEQKSLYKYGEVLAIGDEVQKVRVGDVVGFIEWGMKDLVIGEEKFYLILEDDRFILGKINENNS